MNKLWHFQFIYIFLLITPYLLQKCPHKQYQQLVADYVIAGFVPVHVWEADEKRFGINQPGIVWSAAIAYAVQKINSDHTILPDITLGFDIRDSCNNHFVATEEALEFILDTKYLQPKVNLSKHEGELCVNANNSHSIIAGVIGSATSTLSTLLNTVISTDYIPQVSYSATSMSLSNRKHYRSFSRTVPSDIYQAEAIADLLKAISWTYVSAFASDDDYGRLGLHELRVQIKQRGLCFATDKTFNPSPSIDEIDDIVDHITSFGNSSHVVILWCQTYDAMRILSRTSHLSNVIWIGTETWGTYKDVKQYVNRGIISLDVWQPEIQSFNDHFLSNDISLCQNPWVSEYADLTFGPGNCIMALTFQLLNSLEMKKIAQVIGAVYTLANGLHATLNCSTTNCTQRNGMLDYQDIYKNILKQNFTLLDSPFRVEFDQKGEFKQNFYQFKFYTNQKSTSNFVTFGNWKGSGQLFINETLIDWGPNGKPFSRCSEACKPGYYKIEQAKKCCWSCERCSKDHISINTNQQQCTPCLEKTQIANENQTKCIELKHMYLRYDSSIGIGVIFGSCFGVFLTAVFLLIFIIHWETPIVKSSSREMSCLQLLSLLLLFCLPTVYMVDTTLTICILRTVLFGFLLTTVISIIVTKTYRLHRVFNERFTKVSKFLHNKYQIFFSYIIVLILIVAVILFNVFFRHDISIVRDTASKTVHFECGKTDNILLWVILAYCFVLALTCGYVCFHARKLPENFNETQYISFAMFTICVVWLMFIPLYASLRSVEYTVAFLSINYVSALSLLLILYGYKVRIIVFLPHYNSPEHFRQTAAKTTIAHFQRDVENGRHRYQSVVMFDYVDSSPPRRRLSLRDIPDVIEEAKETLLRRASFSGLSHRESTHISRVSLDNLLRPVGYMKKSKSTPMFLDENADVFESNNLWKPSSHVFDKMVSATSLNRLFTDRRVNTSVELTGLLSEETHL